MPKDSKQQKGFALLITLVIIAIVGLVVAAFFLVKPKLNPQNLSRENHNFEQSATQTKVEWPILWGPPDSQNKCQKITDVKFSSLPMSIKDISYVEPIGELREGHIIPGDHAGIDYKTSPLSSPVKVFAPADGYLVRVEKHPYEPPAGYPKDIQHYHVYLEH